MQELEIKLEKELNINIENYHIKNLKEMTIKLYNLYEVLGTKERGLDLFGEGLKNYSDKIEIEQNSFVLNRDGWFFTKVVPDYLLTTKSLNRILVLSSINNDILNEILNNLGKDQVILATLNEAKDEDTIYKFIPKGRSGEIVKFKVNNGNRI